MEWNLVLDLGFGGWQERALTKAWLHNSLILYFGELEVGRMKLGLLSAYVSFAKTQELYLR
jgi:hypothetical protein